MSNNIVKNPYAKREKFLETIFYGFVDAHNRNRELLKDEKFIELKFKVGGLYQASVERRTREVREARLNFLRSLHGSFATVPKNQITTLTWRQ